MKKKIIMMAGAFVAGGAAVTALRHYLKKKENERLTAWDEEYEDEEDEINEFGFDEDLDEDFEMDVELKEQLDRDTLEEVVEYLLDNRISLTDTQVENILRALELRKVEILAGIGRKGGKHE